jgi:hypothetical protein
VTSNCTSFDECVGGRCTMMPKVCDNNCNDNGACPFVSTDTAQPVSSCFFGDPLCRAVCKCNTGYVGAQCEASDAEHIVNTDLRILLLKGLTNLTLSQDPDLFTVSSWATTAVSLAQNHLELNLESVTLLLDIISTVIKWSSSLALPYYEVN